MNRISIKTKDSFLLIAHHFKPKKPNGKVILINAATGVRQHFYFRYAKFLKQKGYNIITYDYRGIGLSKHTKTKNLDASMTDWASKDFTAVSDYINLHFNNDKKILIGHSFGGSSLGLSQNAGCFDAYITIASQFGYWKLFNPSYRLFVLWLFYLAIPVLTRIYGYFPSKIKRLGENLPKGVAYDWITLITHPDSILELTKKTGNFYADITKPMLMISFSDDQMAPKKTVTELAKKVYTKAQVKELHIQANKNEPIGHLNFFKKHFEFNLWEIPINWLNTLEL